MHQRDPERSGARLDRKDNISFQFVDEAGGQMSELGKKYLPVNLPIFDSDVTARVPDIRPEACPQNFDLMAPSK